MEAADALLLLFEDVVERLRLAIVLRFQLQHTQCHQST